MKIGIDIDGTITAIRDYIINNGKTYFKGIKPNLKGYEVADIFGVGIKGENEFWNKLFFDYLQNAKVLPHAVKVINTLSQNNKIYILTSRVYKEDYRDFMDEEGLIKLTLDYLKKNNINHDELIFTSDKLKTTKDLGLDLFIEDKKEVILSVSKICPVIVIDNEYNCDINGKNIYHANDWNKVLDIIKNI